MQTRKEEGLAVFSASVQADSTQPWTATSDIIPDLSPICVVGTIGLQDVVLMCRSRTA